MFQIVKRDGQILLEAAAESPEVGHIQSAFLMWFGILIQMRL